MLMKLPRLCGVTLDVINVAAGGYEEDGRDHQCDRQRSLRQVSQREKGSQSQKRESRKHASFPNFVCQSANHWRGNYCHSSAQQIYLRQIRFAESDIRKHVGAQKRNDRKMPQHKHDRETERRKLIAISSQSRDDFQWAGVLLIVDHM